MPIILPHDLPAGSILRAEGVSVLDRAPPDRGPPLQVALVNLMPNKPVAEVQIARMLAGAARPVEPTLVVPGGYTPTSTPAEHVAAFYRTWSQVKAKAFDGVVITGAPVEQMPFEAVAYWQELCDILDWAAATARSTWCICWAAQAALRHFHGVPKHALAEKAFGVYRLRTDRRTDPLLAGIEDGFAVPVSRHTETRVEDIAPWMNVQVLATCGETGAGLLRDTANRMVLSLNHPEYDAETLPLEWRRDRMAGLRTCMPVNTFPFDDPGRPPRAYWRPTAQILFRNWVAELEARPLSGNATTRWLTGRAGLAADGTGDLRITLDDPVLGINRVLEVLGRMEVPCLSVRRDGRDVLARVDGIAAADADRLVRRLRCALDAVAVAYRADGGMAGALAVGTGGGDRDGAAPARPAVA